MKGFAGGMQNFVKQANQLQAKIKKTQEELETREFEGTAGGSAVHVVLKGTALVQSVKIGEDLAKSGDVEMLQDLIVAAVNDALKNAKETSAKEMEKVTGGFNVPGLF